MATQVKRYRPRKQGSAANSGGGPAIGAPYVDNANILAWDEQSAQEALDAVTAELDRLGLKFARRPTRGRRRCTCSLTCREVSISVLVLGTRMSFDGSIKINSSNMPPPPSNPHQGNPTILNHQNSHVHTGSKSAKMSHFITFAFTHKHI